MRPSSTSNRSTTCIVMPFVRSMYTSASTRLPSTASGAATRGAGPAFAMELRVELGDRRPTTHDRAETDESRVLVEQRRDTGITVAHASEVRLCDLARTLRHRRSFAQNVPLNL